MQTLQPNYQLPYQQLLAILVSHEEPEGTESGKIEACFKCCTHSWGRVQEAARQTGFKTEEDEIHFFKEVKPRFTGYIEYYTHRYHALLFRPVHHTTDKERMGKAGSVTEGRYDGDREGSYDGDRDGHDELVHFWKWEIRKIHRFHEQHEEFCRYTREGATYRDSQYFLRKAPWQGTPSQETQTRGTLLPGRMYDNYPDLSSTHDHLLALIRAYELYERHIEAEIERLRGYFFLAK